MNKHLCYQTWLHRNPNLIERLGMIWKNIAGIWRRIMQTFMAALDPCSYQSEMGWIKFWNNRYINLNNRRTLDRKEANGKNYVRYEVIGPRMNKWNFRFWSLHYAKSTNSSLVWISVKFGKETMAFPTFSLTMNLLLVRCHLKQLKEQQVCW